MTPLQLTYPAVLASASPRRQELLRRIVREFETDPADLDEDALTTSDPLETAGRLALAKGEWVARRQPKKIVISGDTVVALDGRQFSKPRSTDEACAMLAALAGRTHAVITAMAIIAPEGKVVVFADTAQVTFRALSSEEITRYVATGEPMDKAGAYAIQGGAAGFVTSLEGEVETVIGLPIKQLAVELERLGLTRGTGPAKPGR